MMKTLTRAASFLHIRSIAILTVFVLLAQIAFGQEEDDPDMPKLGKVNISAEEFMKLRSEAIGMKRGIELNKPFDPSKRIVAIGQMEQQKARLSAMTNSPQTNAALTAWTEIGPNPIPNGQVQTGAQLSVSGRTVAIAVNPTDPNILYVGTAQGGLYRSLDGGATWVPLLDGALSLAVNTVAIAPSQPSTIFVGTGESAFSGDSYFGVGIYRIDNANSANPTITGPIGASVFTGRSVSKIVVHPTDPNIIFAASTSGIGGIGASGLAAPANRGLFRSTDALSASPTFTQLTVATLANNRNILDIVMDPGNPNLVLCTEADSFNAGEGGIYQSTNALAATPTFVRTFTAGVGTNLSRTELALVRIGGVVTIYAASAFNGGTVQRSIDGGATWTQRIDNNFCGGQCFYNIAIDVDPTDADRVYLGGTGTTTTFAFSINGGTTFTNSQSGLHTDSHAIAVAPSSPSTIYFGSDGGIYKSTDAGLSWTSLNNSTFRATQFMSIAVHPTDPNFTIGGTQDNGTNWYQPAGTWIRADGGDGGYSLIDQGATDNTNVDMYHTYFNASNLQGYATTATATGSWTFRGCNGVAGNGIPCGGAVLFYAPIEQGPGTPNTVYYGANILYRSADKGLNHTAVSQNLTSPISAIGISPQNDNVRIVGQNTGGLFGTTTGSATLTNLDAGGTVPDNFIARAVIDPNNVNTAYVTLSAFGVVNVWKTINLSNATPAWTAAATGIPQVPVNAFVVDPANSNNLFAGTDIGVYSSTDAGATWNPFGTGLPVVAVFDMAITPVGRMLRIATHGRGMWEIAVPVVVPTITATGTLAAFTACAGTASAEKTFTVAGSNLTDNLTVTAPTGFEVSTTTGTGFGTSITPLVPSGGTVNTTTIFVRMAATATGTPSGNIACASTGAVTQNVAASGTVNNASTLTVTNNNDAGAGSLRQAVLDACPGSTITFSGVTSPITLTTGEIIINKNLTITGPVASPLSVSGNNSSRVFNITSNASVNINNLTITGGNAAGNGGGGIYNTGNGTTTLNNIVFLGNSAGSGGGLFNFGPATLTNVVFSNNIATSTGGALQNNGTFMTVILNNVVFSGNSVTGGAGLGGAIVNAAAIATFNNCTFYGNSATGTGGAMYNVNSSNTQIKNCIFRGNSAPAFADIHDYNANSITTITTSLFGTDPLFVNAADPDGADNLWITADDGLRLQSGSPAVNTGTAAGAPATDILGLARVGNTDMGAYELAAVPVITATGTLSAFTACAGTASAEQTFTVAGSNLTANLTVAAPTGFEVSTTTGTGFGTSITPLVPSGGTVNTTTIFVRMAATATGTPSGNIACASSGATTQNVAASGTVNALPVITTPSVTQPTCATPTGTIVVNPSLPAPVSAGPVPETSVGPEFSVNNGGTWSTNNTFGGLPPGSYNIKVRLTASPSCVATYSGNPVVLTAATGCCVPPVITAPTVTQPTCATGVGSIVVNATGGGVLEYALNNGTYQTSNTFSGLTVGNYNITVRLQASPTCLAAYSGNPVVINAPSCPGKTIPGRVEAEAWDTKSGPQYAVATGDPQGGVQHVVGIVNGSWMDYNVVVLQNGLYNVTFRVATTQNNPQFQIKLGATVLGTVSIPNTGGWNSWQNITVNNIALTAGARTIRIQSVSNETANFNWTDWVVAGANTAPTANAGPNQTVTNPPTTQVTLAGSGAANNGGTIISHVWSKFNGPAGGNITDPNNYGTTVTALQVGTYVFRLTVTDNASQTATSDVTIIVNPASGKFIPGRIEAEAWDTKAGPQYAIPTTDPEGGVRHVIGMTNGSWLDYNVNVTQAGAYTVTFRVATTQNSSQFQIKQGANVLATVNIPNSSGWDNWINVPVTGVQLTGTGTQTLRIQLSSNESCNFNWMDWQLTGAATAPSVTAGVDNPVITLPVNQVTLNGSGTANNGGSITNHQWTKFSGPAGETITNPGNYGTTVTGLVAGTYVFRLTVTQNDNQTASADVTVTVNPVAGGNGKTIPGKVEAEAWDAKQGPQYAVPTGDAGGGQQVVGMTNGSWLDYNVTVLQTGSYTVNFRIATTQNNVQFQVRSMPGNTLLKTVNITNTGGWDSWQTIVVNDIALTAGLQTIRIQQSSNESCNFNWTNWVFGAPPIAPLTIAIAKQPAETDVKINNLQVSVLPNPTSSYFNLRVQTKSMEQVTVRILDIAGRQVQQLKGNPGQAIRFGDKIMNGTYFVEVRQGAEKVVLKVMKQ